MLAGERIACPPPHACGLSAALVPVRRGAHTMLPLALLTRLHGANRLGGNSLLECAVFGRLTGKEAVSYMARLSSL